MRGRKTTPTALKVLTGNPGHRPLPENEPAFKTKIPKCPLKLNAVGKKTWEQKSKLLFKFGVLTEADGETLASYCLIWSHIVAQSEKIEELKSDLTGDDTKIEQKMNKCYIRLSDFLNQYKAYSALLGLDPANRGKIKVNKPPTKTKDNLFD